MPNKTIYAVAWSPDGRWRLAAAGNAIGSTIGFTAGSREEYSCERERAVRALPAVARRRAVQTLVKYRISRWSWFGVLRSRINLQPSSVRRPSCEAGPRDCHAALAALNGR